MIADACPMRSIYCQRLSLRFSSNEIKEQYDVSMGGSPGELSEELVTQEKRKKGWRMNCDVGEATEGLEKEL